MKSHKYIRKYRGGSGKWIYVYKNPKNSELKAAKSIQKQIEKNGYKAYLVGGFVRDHLMGIPSHDIDISTNMPITEIERIFGKKNVYDIGQSKDFGIVVVNKNGHSFEVAQFRKESGYSDGRHPDNVEIVSNFKDDASRRDFTINALGMDSKGKIIDYFGGQKDIKNKIIRTVGTPEDRFKEDYLRMMRAVRFAAKLGFKIDPKTFEAIKKYKKNIIKISPERIKEEIFKIGKEDGKKFANFIELMDKTGLLEIVLPEVANLKNYYEEDKNHPEAYKYGKGRVYDHVLHAIRQNKIKNPLVNLAVLFHDLGKGTTHKIIDGKGHTYHGHDVESVRLIEDLTRRLKFSNEEREILKFAAQHHMRINPEMKPSKIAKLVLDKKWPYLKATVYADNKARGYVKSHLNN